MVERADAQLEQTVSPGIVTSGKAGVVASVPEVPSDQQAQAKEGAETNTAQC